MNRIDLDEALRARVMRAAIGLHVGAALAGCGSAEDARRDPDVRANANEAPAPMARCEAGTAARICFEPGEPMRSPSMAAHPPDPPASAYDDNGCLPLEHVSNGCCNAPAAGPLLLGGECCYDFCDDSCCGRPFIVD